MIEDVTTLLTRAFNAPSGWLTDTPATWPDPPPMSTLHAILLFVGVPLAMVVIITLLVMAPSIVRGPRYRLTQDWVAGPEWFGRPDGLAGTGREAKEIGSAQQASKTGQPTGDGSTGHDVGGASARW